MQLKFYTLDVFTSTRFEGNPLAVVLGADGLDTTRMQAIAREFNLSETVFVQTPGNPAHSAKVRIFTPAAELPFAGHPTVGTAALLAELKAADPDAPHEAIVILEETIGAIRVGVRMRPGSAPYAEFDTPKLPEALGGLPPTDLLAEALSLTSREIGFENHKPSRYSAGVPYTFVPVASLAAIAKAAPDMRVWGPAFGESGHNAAYVYCRETAHMTAQFHARMFVPGQGVPEDPATGSAAAAFAGVVQRFDSLPDGSHKKIIEQGFEMGRPSLIELSLVLNAGKLATVRIGGHAVRVSEGLLEI
jgi:trans-2,3-dihydro-3-hydroxyanthranilate isomerase